MDTKHYLADESEYEYNFSHFSGILHDVKNLMCAIINTTELLILEIPEEHTNCKKLQMILQLTQHCIQLLTSSQPVSGYNCNFETLELNVLIDDVVSMIEFQKNKNIFVEVFDNDSNAVVYGNKTELESALLNVCINAIEAMSETGALRICVSIIERIEKSDLCTSDDPYKKFIQIDISDTGTGITPEKIPFIFNPFFSTKQDSGGPQRGMGLYRTKRCICAHGGTIEVQSTPSRGTTFTILLPALESN